VDLQAWKGFLLASHQDRTQKGTEKKATAWLTSMLRGLKLAVSNLKGATFDYLIDKSEKVYHMAAGHWWFKAPSVGDCVGDGLPLLSYKEFKTWAASKENYGPGYVFDDTFIGVQ